ncbi:MULTISPECIES: DNA-binding protein [unclassified Haladaptatus]|uniref:DNA-binding protein n=1 Tax=unclassified Haladaptatus TaxID=2622732 RepID=UPI00209BF724|nr:MULTISPECIES: DNA-binding protein [unclassified Haladaptatus]MCO8242937.1 DNA-binding protein [Haladaptatus sp. AB643]MCO8252693.1 DNA-binding protein [Haladaptatus sp. AB618]
MSGNPDDERLEELRKQRMEELQDQQQQEESQQQAQQQANAQKQALLRQYLTDGARKRLNSVRMSKPQFAEQVEQQILAIAQSGRINGKIDDAKMKELLRELKPEKTSFNIKRR